MIYLNAELTKKDCLRICQGLATLQNTMYNLDELDKIELEWLWKTFSRCHERTGQYQKIKLTVK